MKVQLTAAAPTSYQLQSLRGLAGSLPTTQNPDGSFSLSFVFDTREEAKQHLKERAFRLFDDRTEYREAIAEINRYSMLTYDCLTACIERI